MKHELDKPIYRGCDKCDFGWGYVIGIERKRVFRKLCIYCNRIRKVKKQQPYIEEKVEENIVIEMGEENGTL